MKSTVETVGQLKRKINVEIPVETVNQVFSEILKDFQKQASIKGFRLGKAPIQTVKTVYRKEVSREALGNLVQKHYVEALKANSLNPITEPHFHFEPPIEDQGFSFTAEFEIRPEIKLKKYEGLEVEREKFSIDPSRVEKIIQNIRESNAIFVPVLIDRPAAIGDIAVIDFEGFVNGSPLNNGKGESHDLELGSKSFIDGFEEGIEGMTPGQEKTLRLQFPTPYQTKELEGQPVEFKVKLISLKKKEIPELSEELFKKMGMENTTSETLRATIIDDIERTEKKRLEQQFKDRLVKRLVELNPVEVPEFLLKEQKGILAQDMQKRMKDEGLSDQDFTDYLKKWDGDLDKTARDMVQASFLIQALAEKYNLFATHDELDAKIIEFAAQIGLTEDKVRAFYGRSGQAERLEYMVTEGKVIDFLMKSAKITEVEKLKE